MKGKGWGGGQVAAVAAVAAGQLAAGDEALLQELWPALCGLASNKSEELQFAVGEALSWSFGGNSPPRNCTASVRAVGEALSWSFGGVITPSLTGTASVLHLYLWLGRPSAGPLAVIPHSLTWGTSVVQPYCQMVPDEKGVSTYMSIHMSPSDVGEGHI